MTHISPFDPETPMKTDKIDQIVWQCRHRSGAEHAELRKGIVVVTKYDEEDEPIFEVQPLGYISRGRLHPLVMNRDKPTDWFATPEEAIQDVRDGYNDLITENYQALDELENSV
jgi:hypothetical protein